MLGSRGGLPQGQREDRSCAMRQITAATIVGPCRSPVSSPIYTSTQAMHCEKQRVCQTLDGLQVVLYYMYCCANLSRKHSIGVATSVRFLYWETFKKASRTLDETKSCVRCNPWNLQKPHRSARGHQTNNKRSNSASPRPAPPALPAAAAAVATRHHRVRRRFNKARARRKAPPAQQNGARRERMCITRPPDRPLGGIERARRGLKPPRASQRCIRGRGQTRREPTLPRSRRPAPPLWVVGDKAPRGLIHRTFPRVERRDQARSNPPPLMQEFRSKEEEAGRLRATGLGVRPHPAETGMK